MYGLNFFVCLNRLLENSLFLSIENGSILDLWKVKMKRKERVVDLLVVNTFLSVFFFFLVRVLDFRRIRHSRWIVLVGKQRTILSLTDSITVFNSRISRRLIRCQTNLIHGNSGILATDTRHLASFLWEMREMTLCSVFLRTFVTNTSVAQRFP